MKDLGKKVGRWPVTVEKGNLGPERVEPMRSSSGGYGPSERSRRSSVDNLGAP